MNPQQQQPLIADDIVLMNQQQQQPLIADDIVLDMFPANGAKYSVHIVCPNCKMEGMTTTIEEKNTGMYILVVIFCLISPPLGICCLCFGACDDEVKQYCRFCNALVGQSDCC